MRLGPRAREWIPSITSLKRAKFIICPVFGGRLCIYTCRFSIFPFQPPRKEVVIDGTVSQMKRGLARYIHTYIHRRFKARYRSRVGIILEDREILPCEKVVKNRERQVFIFCFFSHLWHSICLFAASLFPFTFQLRRG